MAGSSLVKNREPGHGFEKRRDNRGKRCIEEPSALRSAKDQQMRRSFIRGRKAEEVRSHRNTCDLGIAKIGGSGWEANGCGLDALADETVRKPRALGSKAMVGMCSERAAAMPGPDA